ncbi:unnamed protein product [Prunus armeniaca]
MIWNVRFVEDGWWDIDKLRDALTDELVQKVIGTPVGFNSNLQDIQISRPAANGMFTVKTAYELLVARHGWSDPLWEHLWRLKVPPKLKFFLWLVCYGKILSNEHRYKRQLTLDPSCSICGGSSETVLRILRECPQAKEVWRAILLLLQVPHFFQHDLQPWLSCNILNKNKGCAGLPWNTIFGFTCWYIWKWRNHCVFNSEEALPYCPQNTILKAANAKEWLLHAYVSQPQKLKVLVSLAWVPPDVGWFKLNVDGSRRFSSGTIGTGGVLRNCNGDWVEGFTASLGQGQVLDAEIWGLFFGLKLAVACNISHLTVEMDSALVVQLIQMTDPILFHPLTGIAWLMEASIEFYASVFMMLLVVG